MKQTRSLSEFSCLSEYTRLYSIAPQEKWQQIPRVEIKDPGIFARRGVQDRLPEKQLWQRVFCCCFLFFVIQIGTRIYS